MNELRLESFSMPSGEIGKERIFPPLKPLSSAQAISHVDSSLSEDERRNIGIGIEPHALPYSIQSGYGRKRSMREFRTAVLENNVMRATFLLEFGGRLWSLFHKKAGRELLYRNPVFQPANLAIRDAWFSGGVEWNIGILGHCPFTYSPLFTAEAAGYGGMPCLRMYEWERIRQTPFQVDCFFPDDDSAFLNVAVRIVNPNDHPVRMYWWSNIAVPETSRTRVLCPATSAITHEYPSGITKVPVPVWNGVDASYPANLARAIDFFYVIPDGHRRWEAAVDGDGSGLVHVSSEILKGRKLFVWGTGKGGRRWQDFLSEPGHPYLEIQAGIARSQMETISMEAHSELSWLEAYGLLEADPGKVHGTDWNCAVAEVDRFLDAEIPRPEFDRIEKQHSSFLKTAPSKLLQQGSGWGALELMRLKAAGKEPFCDNATPFPETSLTKLQAPWIGLLESGTFFTADDLPRPDWIVQDEWRELLEHAAADNYYRRLHLGVMHYHAGDKAAAENHWRSSLSMKENVAACRNLAVLLAEQGKPDEAVGFWLKALSLLPGDMALLEESEGSFIASRRAKELLDIVRKLPKEKLAKGRMRLLMIRLHIELGETDSAAALFAEEFETDDLREGENTLAELWWRLSVMRLAGNRPANPELLEKAKHKFPMPAWLNFYH